MLGQSTLLILAFCWRADTSAFPIQTVPALALMSAQNVCDGARPQGPTFSWTFLITSTYHVIVFGDV